MSIRLFRVFNQYARLQLRLVILAYLCAFEFLAVIGHIRPGFYAQYGMYSANFTDADVGSLRLIRPASIASRIRLET